MMNRRNFFQRVFQTAAIIALAPRLAFSAPEEKWLKQQAETLDLQAMNRAVFDLARARQKRDIIDVYTDAETARKLTNALF
jgi:hypothetical protein